MHKKRTEEDKHKILTAIIEESKRDKTSDALRIALLDNKDRHGNPLTNAMKRELTQYALTAGISLDSSAISSKSETLIDRIQYKPFYQITIDKINPYSDRELVGTTYILGSPGSGKSRFLLRLKDETKGKLVIESGVFDIFQKYVTDYVDRKHDEGQWEVDFRDGDFDMPNIDGLVVYDNFTVGLERNTKVNNAPYSGVGAFAYREFLTDISSGGKSGFPDWLFIPISDSEYVQVISFPGHRHIETALQNKSIPKIPHPTSVIYLVDPEIQAYHHPDWTGEHKNPALDACDKHLSDMLELEGNGIPTYWFLSKTTVSRLEFNKGIATEIYSKNGIDKIVKRLGLIAGFDSLESSKEEIYNKVQQIIGIK